MPAKPNPARAEATGGPLTATWRDLTLHVPPTDQWPLDVFEAFEDGKVIGAVRALLGPDQWTQVKASTPTPTLADLNTLTAAISNAAGFTSAGESSASTGS